ncbi:MAG: hypothetical protein RIS70_380 [Planctomycetota bacterium]
MAVAAVVEWVVVEWVVAGPVGVAVETLVDRVVAGAESHRVRRPEVADSVVAEARADRRP